MYETQKAQAYYGLRAIALVNLSSLGSWIK